MLRPQEEDSVILFINYIIDKQNYIDSLLGSSRIKIKTLLFHIQTLQILIIELGNEILQTIGPLNFKSGLNYIMCSHFNFNNNFAKKELRNIMGHAVDQIRKL